MSYSARHKRSARDRHAGRHSPEDRRNARTSLPQDRAENGPAEMPADQEAQAQQPLGAPTQE